MHVRLNLEQGALAKVDAPNRMTGKPEGILNWRKQGKSLIEMRMRRLFPGSGRVVGDSSLPSGKVRFGGIWEQSTQER
jgi:hypothetical protein